MTDLKEKEIELLKNQIKLLKEVALFYADPLKEYDNGEFALKVIKRIGKPYKPLNSELAIIFKEKPEYPFVVFEDILEGEDETLDDY